MQKIVYPPFPQMNNLFDFLSLFRDEEKFNKVMEHLEKMKEIEKNIMAARDVILEGKKADSLVSDARDMKAAISKEVKEKTTQLELERKQFDNWCAEINDEINTRRDVINTEVREWKTTFEAADLSLKSGEKQLKKNMKELEVREREAGVLMERGMALKEDYETELKAMDEFRAGRR